MRLALVVNPSSGTAPEPARLAALLGAGGAQVSVTAIGELAPDGSAELDATSLAAAARALSARGVPDRIVVAGGDGSLGLTALLAAEMGVPLAIVAVGTANDFARAQDLPLELEPACALACDPRAATRRAELALAGARPFVNAAAAGLSVQAAREASPYKSRLGPLAYAAGALRAGGTGSPLRCRVRCDGRECYAGRAWQIIVAATGAFGGGSEIGPTSPTHRLLDVAIVPAGSRLGLLRRAWGMRRGRLTAQPGVAHQSAATIEIDMGEPDPTFNVDGELCRCEPAHFTLRPGGFEVIVAGATAHARGVG